VSLGDKMKSFKQHLERKDYIPAKQEKIYPSSFEKIPRLMQLVKKHDDPLKFILAVITAMASGKLKLPIIGAGSTREVAALWNDHKRTKIPANMIELKLSTIAQQLKSLAEETELTEAPVKIKAKLGRAVAAGGHGGGRDEKGFVHKSGKIIVWKGMKPYHVQYIVKNLSKFGIREKEVLDVLEARFDSSFGAPNPKKEAKEYLEQLIAGTPYDRDSSIEYLAMKKGWCRVVLGKYASIGGYDIQTIHQVAKQIDKKKDWTKGIKSLELWEYGEGQGSIKSGELATTKLAGRLDNAYDVGLWVDGGSADPQNVGRGRTEIGRTMAQFREWTELVESMVCGDCFKWANDWNIEHHKGGTHKVVHGIVTNGLGQTFPHAWIEDKGKVYDTNIGESGRWSIKKFYKSFKVENAVKYTPREATRNQFGGFGHHGPWDKSFDKWPTTK